MALRQTLPRKNWPKSIFWMLHKKYKDRLTRYIMSDSVAPEILNAIINETGTQITLIFSKNITTGNDGGDSWAINCSSSTSILMQYIEGNRTNIFVYDLSSTPLLGENCTVSYTQSGDGIVDFAGNYLEDILNFSVINNSEVQ